MSRFKNTFPVKFDEERQRRRESQRNAKLPQSSCMNEPGAYDFSVMERVGRVGKMHDHYVLRGTGQQFLLWMPPGATVDDEARPMILHRPASEEDVFGVATVDAREGVPR